MPKKMRLVTSSATLWESQEFAGGAKAAFEGAEHCAGLRVGDGGLPCEKQRVLDRRAKQFRQMQTVHGNVAVGALNVRIMRPIVSMSGAHFIAQRRCAENFFQNSQRERFEVTGRMGQQRVGFWPAGPAG